MISIIALGVFDGRSLTHPLPQVVLTSMPSYAKKPRSEVEKRLIRGNTADKSAVDKPYHVARVAAYCSTEVVGIQRPRGFDPPSVSSGPPRRNVGYAP